MKRIIIENIDDAMFAQIVNGFDGSSDAATRLSPTEQQTLVGARIFAYCSEVAKSQAVMAAREAAAQTATETADAMIAQQRQTLQVSVTDGALSLSGTTSETPLPALGELAAQEV